MSSGKPFYAVIMAGGTGTRLWPLSRREKPKQFHAFLSEKTMLQETFNRVRATVPLDHIFISTGTQYRTIIREQLPEISEDCIITEPDVRNTGPAICLAALWITDLHPDAIVATIASDHAIKNPGEFTETLLAAFETAERSPDKLIVVGINPTNPDTGLGYIKLGREFATVRQHRVFVAESFKEKPDQKTAEEYLRSFDYLWNAGYFIFSGTTLRKWLGKLAPDLEKLLGHIIDLKQSGKLDEKNLAELYHETPAIAIDYLLAEKLPPEERLVIPSPLEWSDVGNWNTLHSFLNNERGKDLVALGTQCDLGSRNTLIHGGKRLIATINVKDLVIIDTDDALLVADRESVGTAVKDLLERIKQERPDLL